MSGSGFKCDECGNEFTEKKNLNAHKKSVHGPKVQCDQCQVLLTAGSLRDHVRRIHEGKKQVFNKKKCTVCGKMIGDDHFNQHMRTHTGEKPFTCHFCDYRATRADTIKKHEDTVHWKRKWVCQESGCNWSSRDRSYVNKHLKSKHNIQSDFYQHMKLMDTPQTPSSLTPIDRSSNIASSTTTTNVSNVSNNNSTSIRSTSTTRTTRTIRSTQRDHSQDANASTSQRPQQIQQVRQVHEPVDASSEIPSTESSSSSPSKPKQKSSSNSNDDDDSSSIDFEPQQSKPKRRRTWSEAASSSIENSIDNQEEKQEEKEDIESSNSMSTNQTNPKSIDGIVWLPNGKGLTFSNVEIKREKNDD